MSDDRFTDEAFTLANGDNAEARRVMYAERLGLMPEEEPIMEKSMLRQLTIKDALNITEEMPDIQSLLFDLYEDDADFVEMGIEDGRMVIRAIDKMSPTSSQVHVPSTSSDDEEKPFFHKAADEELRYTFSPWYVPDVLDAHGEWTDRDEVQQSFWKYLARDDRDIRLQHNMDIIAGRWVEGATFPYPVTFPIKHPEGEREYEFPAGTPFLGVVWEPWAWQMIKSGEIRGLSIGGTGKRQTAELEESTGDVAGAVSFTAKMRGYDNDPIIEDSEIEKAKDISVGDTVSFSVPKPPEGNMIARGVVTSIKEDGTLTLPNTSESVEATPDNPAAIVRVYIEDGDEWVESDRSVVKPFTELRSIDDFNKAEVSAEVKEKLRNKVEEHNDSVTAESKKANLRMLTASYLRGIGAYRTNPSSVRPTVSSAEQWAMGRVNGLLHALKTGRFKRGKFDTDLLPTGHPLSTKKELEETTKAKDVETGDFVRWNAGTGVAQGRVTRVVRDGEIDVPDSSLVLSGSRENPALLIRIYRDGPDGWEATDRLVGQRSSTVRSIQPLEKQESFVPPEGVQEEAQRALDWMAEGEAGANFTDVGRRRASQLANGQRVSLDTMRRMRSFLARHEDSSKGGQGFNRGDEGYPSAGRVSWAAWGGDPAKSWVESTLARYED